MGVKRYFSRQFQVSCLKLEHEFTSDFCISCWQKNRAVLPMLCVRTLLFLLCFSILISSMVILGQAVGFGLWFIYLTHWGLVFITVTNGFAVAVSAHAYFRGPIDGTFGLPWYVKAYWVLYNSTVPIAFFITIFYYSLLSGTDEFDIDLVMSPVLDYFVHLVNSMIMLLLLVLSRHPTNILHFYWPLAAGLIYMLFSVVYYSAGGKDPSGNTYVYPMLDWSNPGPTVVLVLVCAVGIILMHCLVAALAALRDKLSSVYMKSSQSLTIINQ